MTERHPMEGQSGPWPRSVYNRHGVAVVRGPEPKVKATKQELVAALREILYIQRADDARKIAERVLGK